MRAALLKGLVCAAAMAATPSLADPVSDEANRQRQMASMRDEAARADRAGADRSLRTQQATADAARAANATSSAGSGPSSGSSGGRSSFGMGGSAAADSGPQSVVAQYTLTIRTRETPAQTIARLGQGAAAGNAEAQYNLGRIYYTGFNDAPRDLARARDYFRQAAAAGHAPSQANYGYFLDNGLGGAADKAEAGRWLKRAADAGNSFGQALYGLQLSTSGDGSAALPYLIPAADAGEPVAQAMLGILYVVGQSPYHDDAKGARYLRLASDGGDAASGYMLAGLMLSNRAGPKADAYPLMKRAAEAGNLEAQFNYGLMLVKGDGYPRNPVLAESMIRRAAVAGFVPAMGLLGDMYNDVTNGIAASESDAVYWWDRGAAAGDQDMIGVMAKVRTQHVVIGRPPAHGTGAVASPPPTPVGPATTAGGAAAGAAGGTAGAAAAGFVACMSMEDVPYQNYFYTITAGTVSDIATMLTGYPGWLRIAPGPKAQLRLWGGDPATLNLNTTCEWYAERTAAEARTRSVGDILSPRGFHTVPTSWEPER